RALVRTPRALSYSTRPATATRPWSGAAMPAIILSVCVLPAPEGPNSTTRRAGDRKATSMWKRESPWRRVFRKAMSQIMATASACGHAARHQPARAQQHGDAEDRGHEHHEVGRAVLPGLNSLVDRDGQRLGLAN